MSKKDASKYIKKLSPKNVSGSIPQALDMVEQLKKVKKDMNPRMVQAVGGQNLMGMLKHIQGMFKKKKKQNNQTQTQNPVPTEDDLLEKEEEERISSIENQAKEV